MTTDKSNSGHLETKGGEELLPSWRDREFYEAAFV